MHYFISIKLIIIKFINKFIFRKKIKWEIYFSKSNFKSINKNKIIKISNTKNSWFADPFFVKKGKSYYIFFEDYDEIKKIGKISCVKILKNNKLIFFRNIIKEDFHLSFPFIFKFNNKYYIIPESLNDNSLRLYECIQFPNKWKFKKKIFNNVRFVDSVIIKKNKTWYIIVSTENKKYIFNKIKIFHSKNPIETKWKEIDHINHNIFGRNGGLIKVKENFLRVEQVYFKGRYGYSYKLNKFSKVSSGNLKEIPYKKNHLKLSYAKNIHTINSDHEFTTFDNSFWE